MPVYRNYYNNPLKETLIRHGGEAISFQWERFPMSCLDSNGHPLVGNLSKFLNVGQLVE